MLFPPPPSYSLGEILIMKVVLGINWPQRVKEWSRLALVFYLLSLPLPLPYYDQCSSRFNVGLDLRVIFFIRIFKHDWRGNILPSFPQPIDFNSNRRRSCWVLISWYSKASDSDFGLIFQFWRVKRDYIICSPALLFTQVLRGYFDNVEFSSPPIPRSDHLLVDFEWWKQTSWRFHIAPTAFRFSTQAIRMTSRLWESIVWFCKSDSPVVIDRQPHTYLLRSLVLLTSGHYAYVTSSIIRRTALLYSYSITRGKKKITNRCHNLSPYKKDHTSTLYSSCSLPTPAFALPNARSYRDSARRYEISLSTKGKKVHI